MIRSIGIDTFNYILLGHQIKEDELGGVCVWHVQGRGDSNIILVGQPSRKDHLENLDVDNRVMLK
jgi:hypothetical protein